MTTKQGLPHILRLENRLIKVINQEDDETLIVQSNMTLLGEESKKRLKR